MGNHLRDTDFWNAVCHDVYGPRDGGAILIIDAEDARKGVAKTSGAVAFAKAFALAFDYDIQKEDLFLSGNKAIERYREQPGKEQPSVVVWDEAVGAGSGDGRRAMSSQNVELGQAWQMLRTKRVLTFVTLPDWYDLDPRLQRLADYRLWCRRHPIGEAHAYEIGTSFQGGDLRTRGLGPGQGAEPISFPDMDYHGDPHYEYISEQKRQLINSDTFDADDDSGEEAVDPETAERQQQIKTVLRAVKPWDENRGMSQVDAAGLVDYSRGWVQNRIKEWEQGEHRDLLEVANA
jgi:hypothetical protein